MPTPTIATDQLILPVTPHLSVALDAAGCIVLRAASADSTITNADALKEALDLVRLYRDNREAAAHAHVYWDKGNRPNDHAEPCRHPSICATTRGLLTRYLRNRTLEPSL